MEKLFDDNTNWFVSRYSKDSQSIEVVKDLTILSLSSKHQFYCSNFAWIFRVENLILKPSLESYFDFFFDPMRELLGIALFWDCAGNIIISEVSPIYISKKNSRKLHQGIEEKIPKGIKGALVIQLFVLEHEFDIESFLMNLDENRFNLSNSLKRRIKTNSFKSCADFLAEQFLETTGVHGHELFRKIYPSFCLNSCAYFKEEETLFYNIVIQIKEWKS